MSLSTENSELSCDPVDHKCCDLWCLVWWCLYTNYSVTPVNLRIMSLFGEINNSISEFFKIAIVVFIIIVLLNHKFNIPYFFFRNSLV